MKISTGDGSARFAHDDQGGSANVRTALNGWDLAVRHNEVATT